MAARGEEGDRVDRILAQWARERPDLDVSPAAVIGRLHRVANRLTDELVAVYATFGLGEGEFDILATLRRWGDPHELTAGELARATMVTSGAISKRVDRCERQGWVVRTRDDRDARGRRIRLTAAGRELIDAAFTAHVANEHRLVGMITERDRAVLAAVLRRWGQELGVD
ncbi:MarR family winged helix-turn-helix transcriptional regulator [Nocardioides sp. SYSU DS0651]|uniref:MarR family winged helix-turn-helix transcriptional regulator n=1 Tax=Nocardioides sp. SYSU DS0651 TaxID=3415955 RepID=UPI003F4C6776